MGFFEEMYRKAVFLVGDIRKLSHPPFFTWAKFDYKMSYQEVLEVLPLIEYGDIGIHRDAGYLSNVAIPGFMKHAWIHTDDGMEAPKCVEALSQGVIKQNPIDAIYSDYTMILRPKGVSEEERKGACLKANGIVGQVYDHKFRFDIENELKYYTGEDVRGATIDLEEGQTNIRKYDRAFSCTEVVAYAWWHRREDLGLYRQKRQGKNVIIADDFVNNGWEIIWMSASVTPDRAAQCKLPEEGIEMIVDFKHKGKS